MLDEIRSTAGMKLKLLFEPGTSFAYSNMAYEVLGDLIAKVSRMSFEDYVDKNILRPLGMNSSTLLLSKADPRLLAEGYTRPRGGDCASLHKVAAYPFNRIHSPSSDLGRVGPGSCRVGPGNFASSRPQIRTWSG